MPKYIPMYGKLTPASIPQRAEVTKNGRSMKISKDECDKEFAEKKLVLSDEKCKQCEYLYLCPFMSHAIDEVTNGDDGF